MKKYWEMVDAGEYEKYGKKLMLIFLKHPHLFHQKNSFWNPVKPSSMNKIFEIIPEFKELEKLYGEINEMALLILEDDTSTLHIDHTSGLNEGVKARLNVPVSNCGESVTCFYELDEQTFSTHMTTPGGTKYWSEELRRKLIPVTQVALKQPTILRTSEPHTVFCNGKNFPRVSLTISFREDLIKYLAT
jgi:hypothetical protein